MLFDPARSAEQPIMFGSFAIIFKKISDDFLVAIVFEFFKYSFFFFSIKFFNDLKFSKFDNIF